MSEFSGTLQQVFRPRQAGALDSEPAEIGEQLVPIDVAIVGDQPARHKAVGGDGADGQDRGCDGGQVAAPVREDVTIGGSGAGIKLGYTINLNLPATSDIAVFDAIFKSLREHLL